MSEKSFVATQDNKVVTYQGISLGKENASTDFNKICVSGFIEEEFEYSHEFLREKFYKTRIRVVRLSGTADYIPIIVSELLMPIAIESGLKGKYVKAEGQLRSYKKVGKDGRKHLELFLFARNIKVYEIGEELEYALPIENLIYLNGHICRQSTFRTTPLGRQITDFVIAVGRPHNKVDYIPCIAWGRAAQYANKLEVGDWIKLYGRVQSREYLKRLSDSEDVEARTTYEVSIVKITKMEGWD